MEKEMMKLDDLRNMKCSLIACLKSQIDGNIQGLDVTEAGGVVDMIKDLAETEKYCMEAKYYETVTDAMEEGSEYERAGYNHNRYSSGRYAPKGSGHYGYRPMVDQEPYIQEYRMGYHDDMYKPSDRYSRAVNEYRSAKRHYTETKNPMDREAMTTHTSEHMNDTIATIREMWKDADVDLKKRMKSDLNGLLAEMTV